MIGRLRPGRTAGDRSGHYGLTGPLPAFTIASHIDFSEAGSPDETLEKAQSDYFSHARRRPVFGSGPAAGSAAVAQSGSFLLTVFLRHDETKTVDEINEHLKQTGWYDKFPPEGVELVAWRVLMGIGQVVILRVPAEKLRETNRVIDRPLGAATGPSSTRPTTSNRSGTQSRITVPDR